jgi:glycosyltransferase involved in cell wall biosynthesis
MFFQAHPEAVSETKLLFIGPKDENVKNLADSLGIGSVVVHVGTVSYEESLRYIDSASVCVLIESQINEGIYFPSKLADYIAAAKPILAMSPPCGFVSDIVREGGIRRVNANDEEGIAAAIGDFYEAFSNNRLVSFGPSETLVHQVSPSAVAEKFLHAVESVCRKLV